MLIWGAGIYFFLVIGDGDRPKTMACLDESLVINRELRLRPLMGRVLAREILGA